MGRGEIEFRQAITDNCPVLLGGKCYWYNITFPVIDHPLARIVDSGITPHIKVADGLPHFDTLEIIAQERAFDPDFIIVVFSDIVRIAETDEFVLIGRTIALQKNNQ